MANEHTHVVQKTAPQTFTVADGAGIEKGELLKLTTPRTAAASAAKNDIIAGIAASEKIASDGNVSLGVITGPGDEFVATASNTITVGDAVGTALPAGSNKIRSLAADDDLSNIQRLGFALQSATDAQSIRYRLDLGVKP